MSPRSVIESSPEVMSGAVVFAGTRVPVKTLFDYLKGGKALDEFLDDFPTVTREQALTVLDIAGRDVIDAASTRRVAAKKTQGRARSA